MLFPNTIEPLGDGIYIKGNFHQFQMLFVDISIYLGFDFRFHDMENGQIEGHASQRSHPTGIAVDEGLSVELRAVGVGGSQDDDEIVIAKVIRSFFYQFLTFQVKGTCGRSDKTLGLGHHRLTACTLYTGFNGRSLNAIPFTNDNHFFTFDFHA